MFKCDMCGACCRNIGGISLFEELDRGDGVCKYLVGNRCSIYAQRPLLCRVDESYEAFWKEQISLEDYYRLNYASCDALKQMEREGEYGRTGAKKMR